MIDDETPKYHKKSTKRGRFRSKHKHEYVLVPVKYEWTKDWNVLKHYAKVCTKCGYLTEVYWTLWQPLPELPILDMEPLMVVIGQKLIEGVGKDD